MGPVTADLLVKTAIWFENDHNHIVSLLLQPLLKYLINHLICYEICGQMSVYPSPFWLLEKNFYVAVTTGEILNNESIYI